MVPSCQVEAKRQTRQGAPGLKSVYVLLTLEAGVAYDYP